jgi:hypothetical protein
MGSMIGYSKIFETIQQFRVWRKTGDISAIQDAIDDTKV